MAPSRREFVHLSELAAAAFAPPCVVLRKTDTRANCWSDREISKISGWIFMLAAK
jgi:hypothetical protein